MNKYEESLRDSVAALKLALDLHPNDPYHESVLSELSGVLKNRPETPEELKTLWKVSQENNIILPFLELVKKSPPTEVASLSEGPPQFNAILWRAALQTVRDTTPTPQDLRSLGALGQSWVPISEGWWESAQDFVHQWNAQSSFFSKAVPHYSVMQLICDEPNSTSEKWPPLKQVRNQMMESAKIAEFLLTFWVFTEPMPGPQSADIYRRRATFLKLYTYCAQRPAIRSIPKAILSSGGPVALSSKLVLEIKDDTTDTPESPLTLLSVLVAAPSVVTSLAENGDLGICLVSILWDIFLGTQGSPIKYRNGLLLQFFCHAVKLIDGPEDQIKQRMENILTQFDFTAMVAKCLYIWGTSEAPANPSAALPPAARWTERTLHQDKEAIEETVPKLCETQPELLRTSLMKNRDYLNLLDRIRMARNSSRSGHGDIATTVWERLGTIAGLSETELRKEAIAAQQASSGGIIGCSWYKCIMHRQPSDTVMHWCSGCRKAVYCGYFCKTKDWDEGHKDICGRQAPAAAEKT